MISAITRAVGFMAGNYVYQAATARDWSVAHDHTFFQAMIVIVVLLPMMTTRGR